MAAGLPGSGPAPRYGREGKLQRLPGARSSERCERGEAEGLVSAETRRRAPSRPGRCSVRPGSRAVADRPEVVAPPHQPLTGAEAAPRLTFLSFGCSRGWEAMDMEKLCEEVSEPWEALRHLWKLHAI